jgi:choline-glycine betaine transporter
MGVIILMMLCGLAVACPHSSSSKLEAGQQQTGMCHRLVLLLLLLLMVVVVALLLLLLAMLIKALGKCTARLPQSTMLLQQQQWRKIVLR